MNAQRRKKLNEALEMLDSVKVIIEECLSEEQDSFDNLPEGIQYSERGEKMENAIGSLESAIDSLDEMVGEINNAIE